MVIKSWLSKWPTLSAYFKYSDYVRTAIYTTNAVEAVHRQFRKLTKTKGGFAKAVIIHRKAFDDVFLNQGGRPYSELRSLNRIELTRYPTEITASRL